MKRSKPPRRKTWLRSSRRPIAPRRADPTKRAWAKHRCDPYREWLKQQPCVVTGKRTGEWFSWLPRQGFRKIYHPFEIVVDPAHLIPRGRGSDDLYNCVSLSHHLHNEQEKRTDQFNAKYGVNLWELAKQQTEEWLATAEGIRWRDAHPTNEDVND